MTEPAPAAKTIVTIDDDRFEVAHSDDIPSLRERIEHAVSSGGRFVDVPVAGSAPVAVLITPRTRVVISVTHEVSPDEGPPSYPSGLRILDDF